MNFLAFDTSTERLSVGVGRASERWLHEGAGGAKASATLIPTALGLLRDAGLQLTELDAIVFGRGPGSFTGLRTACSVAQGLAFGAELPVLPLDTLLAVAEQARIDHGCTHVLALLDARMDQVYAAPWVWSPAAGWRAAGPTLVCAPEVAALPGHADAGWVLAGNAFATCGERLSEALGGLPHHTAQPTATALLSLAPAAMAAGGAVPAEQALPLYIRDKVAQTMAERAAAS